MTEGQILLGRTLFHHSFYPHLASVSGVNTYFNGFAEGRVSSFLGVGGAVGCGSEELIERVWSIFRWGVQGF